MTAPAQSVPAGITIEWMSGNCPVQAEGLIDGQPFYFRARGRRWSLSIGSDVASSSDDAIHGRDVVGHPRWYYEETWGDTQFAAGWMSEDEAVRLIGVGAALYRARGTGPDGGAS